jgi:hypothetical protein
MIGALDTCASGDEADRGSTLAGDFEVALHCKCDYDHCHCDGQAGGRQHGSTDPARDQPEPEKQRHWQHGGGRDHPRPAFE